MTSYFRNMCLISMLSFIGCGFLGVLDTNPYDDAPPGDEVYFEEKIQEIRQELLGLSKTEVKAKLGKPSWINNLGNNYQAPMKFRENELVYDGTKKCRMAECGPIFEDESWAYGWRRKFKRYRLEYGYGVFFKNGVVVAVH